MSALLSLDDGALFELSSDVVAHANKILGGAPRGVVAIQGQSAEDFAHDVLSRHLESGFAARSKEHMKAYLRACAKNRIASAYRRAKQVPHELLPELPDGTEELSDDVPIADRVERAFGSETHVGKYLRALCQDRPPPACVIASNLGVHRDTVYRIRKDLRQRFTPSSLLQALNAG